MIHYTLRCAAGHGFEAWFASGADYRVQAASGLLSCPSCGSVEIDQALMAPAVVTGHRQRQAPDAPPPPGSEVRAAAGANPVAAAAVASPPAAPNGVSAAMPDGVRAMLSRLRDEIERSCDHVGPRFADEALRMHRGQSDRRGIYGEATEAEREFLRDEGVEVASVPWLPRSDG